MDISALLNASAISKSFCSCNSKRFCRSRSKVALSLAAHSKASISLLFMEAVGKLVDVNAGETALGTGELDNVSGLALENKSDDNVGGMGDAAN